MPDTPCPQPHLVSFRVYYEDTDSGGVVYYANYLRFAERARTEWLRALGFGQEAMRKETGISIVVRHVECDFLSSARLDDLLTIETHLHEVGKVRMRMRQVIKCGGTTLATLTVTLACINNTGKPVRWPEPLVNALQGIG